MQNSESAKRNSIVNIDEASIRDAGTKAVVPEVVRISRSDELDRNSIADDSWAEILGYARHNSKPHSEATVRKAILDTGGKTPPRLTISRKVQDPPRFRRDEYIGIDDQCLPPDLVFGQGNDGKSE